MLDTLIALTETGEFEDSGGIHFASADRTTDGLLLKILLVPGDGREEERWQIVCSDVWDFRLHGEFAEELRVVSEHPVMLPFTEHVTSLYFYSPAADPLATVGALWERHRQLVGSWLPFERFLNVLPKGLSALLAASCGELASGPVSLMQAYAQVLIEQGIRFSLLPPQPPKFWDGDQFVAPTRPLEALVFTDSYVIAERFDAERLAPNDE
jgi:hypothetical protein